MIALRLRRSLSAQSVFVVDGEPDFFHTEALNSWLALAQRAALVVVAGLLMAGVVMVAVAGWMWR